VRTAFKEWAIIVDALGEGRQIIILRKGGISEGRKGFAVEHAEFLLFPTLFHQQRASVVPSAQLRYDQIAPGFPGSDILRLELFARVAGWARLASLAAANRLQGQHVWRDEIVAERFDWGREQNIHVMAVRIYRLPKVIEVPMLPSYGGCKSWIQISEDIETQEARPVLSDQVFSEKLKLFHAALGKELAAAE
jgi:hypothetical protein